MHIKESQPIDKINSFISSPRGILTAILLASITLIIYLIHLAYLNSKKVEIETTKILNAERLKESRIASKKFYIINEGILYSPGDYEYIKIDGQGRIFLNEYSRNPEKSINLDSVKLVEFFEVKNMETINDRLKKDLSASEYKINALNDENRILSEKNKSLSATVANYENMTQLKNTELNNKNIEIEKYKTQEKIFNKILTAIKKNKNVTNINELIVSNSTIQTTKPIVQNNTCKKIEEKSNAKTNEELINEIKFKLNILRALSLANTNAQSWNGNLNIVPVTAEHLFDTNIDKLNLMTISLDRGISSLSSRLEQHSNFSRKHIDNEIKKLKSKPL